MRTRLGRQGRQGDKGGNPYKKGIIGHKINRSPSILWIKSSLSSILPSLPGLAFTGWAWWTPKS